MWGWLKTYLLWSSKTFGIKLLKTNHCPFMWQKKQCLKLATPRVSLWLQLCLKVRLTSVDPRYILWGMSTTEQKSIVFKREYEDIVWAEILYATTITTTHIIWTWNLKCAHYTYELYYTIPDLKKVLIKFLTKELQ